MTRRRDDAPAEGEVVIRSSFGRHLALAPVAFAVTAGPKHALVYANTLFQNLGVAKEVAIGDGLAAVDLTALLDRAFQSSDPLRDEIIEAPGGSTAWSCTVWPIADQRPDHRKLVLEVRDLRIIRAAQERQREIAQRLLLSALQEQDNATAATAADSRSRFLSSASRDLSLSLDETTTRDTVRRLTLPRSGTWCIVDVAESNGTVHRLAVVHPDPSKKALARQLEELWPATQATSTVIAPLEHPMVVTQASGAALIAAAHGEDYLRILREIGFGSMLMVPLVVRARVQGTMTFVSPAGDAPFSAEEISIAVDLASRCAMALDNARLYREADALRLAADLANKSKSEFLAGMSHELRTPLNAIGGFAELMEMGVSGPVTEDQQISLARIKANQQHLLKLITEILSFVRLESGRMEYHNENVPMLAALADVSEMLSSAIAEKQLRLDGPAGDGDVVAWADPDRVRQILMNLLMNAVKYTTSGGAIRLSTSVQGDRVEAVVEDTGPGIPPDKLASIFEPFVQLASGLTERRGGVGLGLAISRDLARAMGGELTAESVEGVGSWFTLHLPLGRPTSGKLKSI